MISIVTDDEAKQEIIWGIGFYLENNLDYESKIMKLIERKAFPFIISGLKLKSKQTIRPILRILVHASYSSVKEALKYFEYDLLKLIASLLDLDVLVWAHDICWMFANLLASSGYGFYDKLFEPSIINNLIKWITDKRSQIVVKSAVWTIGMFIKMGTEEPIEKLIVEYNIIEVLMFTMHSGSENVVKEILDCFESLLEFSDKYTSEGMNAVAIQMSRSKYFEFFENLQMVNSTEIYQKVAHLIVKYFHGIIEHSA